jgi:hypothetical protein
MQADEGLIIFICNEFDASAVLFHCFPVRFDARPQLR